MKHIINQSSESPNHQINTYTRIICVSAIRSSPSNPIRISHYEPDSFIKHSQSLLRILLSEHNTSNQTSLQNPKLCNNKQGQLNRFHEKSAASPIEHLHTSAPSPAACLRTFAPESTACLRASAKIRTYTICLTAYIHNGFICFPANLRTVPSSAL